MTPFLMHADDVANACVLEGDDLIGSTVRKKKAFAERSLKVVQAVADRAKCRFVISAIDGDGPGGVLDRSGGGRERHNRPPLQEPDEAGLVVPG